MNSWNEILIDLLILDGNETCLIENIKTYEDYKSLVVEIAKITNGIRWCANDKCKCHPESTVLEILTNKELEKFLNESMEGIVDKMKNLCENYLPHQNEIMKLL